MSIIVRYNRLLLLSVRDCKSFQVDKDTFMNSEIPPIRYPSRYIKNNSLEPADIEEEKKYYVSPYHPTTLKSALLLMGLQQPGLHIVAQNWTYAPPDEDSTGAK